MLIYTLCFHTRCALRNFLCSVQLLHSVSPKDCPPNMPTPLELILYLTYIMEAQT